MKLFRLLIIVFFLAAFISSCTKGEGKGGTASVSGKIKIEEYNYDFSVLKNTYYAQGEDVYIVFGDETVVGEDVETFHDGTYCFDYLRKGKYTIYVYSEDSTGTHYPSMIPVEKEIEITENGQEFAVEDITMLITTRNNSGTSTITGKIYVQDYTMEGVYKPGCDYYAPDEDVFLILGNNDYYMDDVSTNYDGTYKFENLPLGTYKVYAYSKTYGGGEQTGVEPVIKEVTITENFQNVVLDDIIIKK